MTEQETHVLERLQQDTMRTACADYLAGADQLHRHEILTSLAFDRLRYKMELVDEIRANCGGDWNQTFYRLYFRTLGDSSNQAAYLTLAERVPYKIALRERTTPHAVEAMLLGVSGLLGLYEHDTYVLDLLRTFEHLAAKYTLEPMDASAWNLTDIRPANHPLLRIVQAARFFIQDEFVMNRKLECRDPKEVQRLFGVEAPEYWNTHYTPGAECEWHPKRIGKFKSDIIGINLVAVLQFAYGSYMDDERLRENALKLLESIEPENNRFIRSWCDAGVPAPVNAFESQALLQLSKVYCMHGRCAECPVGRRILAKVRRMAPPEE